MGLRIVGRSTCLERYERGVEVSGVFRDRVFRILKVIVICWVLF